MIPKITDGGKTLANGYNVTSATTLQNRNTYIPTEGAVYAAVSGKLPTYSDATSGHVMLSVAGGTSVVASEISIRSTTDQPIGNAPTNLLTENVIYEALKTAGIPQLATASEANLFLTEENEGKCFIYTGETDSTYTRGHIYLVTESSASSGFNITGLTGSPYSDYNGHYELVDSTATGGNRVWSNGTGYVYTRSLSPKWWLGGASDYPTRMVTIIRTTENSGSEPTLEPQNSTWESTNTSTVSVANMVVAAADPYVATDITPTSGEGVNVVSSLPAASADTQGRLYRNTTDGKLYVGMLSTVTSAVPAYTLTAKSSSSYISYLNDLVNVPMTKAGIYTAANGETYDYYSATANGHTFYLGNYYNSSNSGYLIVILTRDIAPSAWDNNTFAEDYVMTPGINSGKKLEDISSIQYWYYKDDSDYGSHTLSWSVSETEVEEQEYTFAVVGEGGSGGSSTSDVIVCADNSAMTAACTADNVDKVCFYIGETNASYTKGHHYLLKSAESLTASSDDSRIAGIYEKNGDTHTYNGETYTDWVNGNGTILYRNTNGYVCLSGTTNWGTYQGTNMNALNAPTISSAVDWPSVLNDVSLTFYRQMQDELGATFTYTASGAELVDLDGSGSDMTNYYTKTEVNSVITSAVSGYLPVITGTNGHLLTVASNGAAVSDGAVSIHKSGSLTNSSSYVPTENVVSSGLAGKLDTYSDMIGGKVLLSVVSGKTVYPSNYTINSTTTLGSSSTVVPTEATVNAAMSRKLTNSISQASTVNGKILVAASNGAAASTANYQIDSATVAASYNGGSSYIPNEALMSSYVSSYVTSNTHSIPSGGTTGQALVKNSNTDFDASWSDVGSGSSNAVTVASESIIPSGIQVAIVNELPASPSRNVLYFIVEPVEHITLTGLSGYEGDYELLSGEIGTSTQLWKNADGPGYLSWIGGHESQTNWIVYENANKSGWVAYVGDYTIDSDPTTWGGPVTYGGYTMTYVPASGGSDSGSGGESGGESGGGGSTQSGPYVEVTGGSTYNGKYYLTSGDYTDGTAVFTHETNSAYTIQYFHASSSVWSIANNGNNINSWGTSSMSSNIANESPMTGSYGTGTFYSA